MPDAPEPDICEVCSSAWEGGDVCSRCGWMRAPAGGDAELELDVATPPGRGGPQARGGRSSLPPGQRAAAGATPAPTTKRTGLLKRTEGERAMARARRAGWIGMLVLAVAGFAALRAVYPRLEVASRLADLQEQALKVVALSGQPTISAEVVRTRARAWAEGQKLTIEPNTLRVRIVQVEAPSTAGAGAAALGANADIGSDRWFRITFKVTTVLSKWSYRREVGIRASRILSLSPSQNASTYEDDGPILGDEPDSPGRRSKPKKSTAEQALPGKGRDLTQEGSATGLGMSVGVFLGDVNKLDADIAALVGVKGLNVAIDDAGWKRARTQVKEIPVLTERIDLLRERAAGLQEAVEVRYGERLGKPWIGMGRSLGLLKRGLVHLKTDSQPSFTDAIDRYDLWHHAAMLKIQTQLEEKGVGVSDSRGSAPRRAAKAKKKDKGDAEGSRVRVRKGKGRRGR